MSDRTPPTARTNPPLYSLLSLVVLVGAVVALIVSGHANESGVYIAVVAAAVPGLVAAASSERVARDIRNGVMQDKVRQGAHEAIAEAEVLTRPGPVVQSHLEAQSAQLAALTALLGHVSTKVDKVVEGQ